MPPLLGSLLAVFVAQADPWEPLKLPEAAGKSLYGMSSLESGSGWIVGESGLCLQTRDGGRTWKLRPLGTAATLRSVRFLNEKTGIIVGDGDADSPKPTGHIVMGRQMYSGLILRTSDGGETWRKSYAPTNFEMHCAETRGGPVQFGISGGEAHLDGDILRTAADLDAWDSKDFKSYRCYRALFDIRAVDDKQWVAVGSAVSVGFVPPPTDPLYTNAKVRALYSPDRGEHWTPSKTSEGDGVLRGLSVDPKGLRILTVGDGGAILSSEDKGASWKPLNSGCTQDLAAVAWCPKDPKLAVAVGDRLTTLVSPDGGQTWKRTSPGGPGILLSVAFFGDVVLAAGDGGRVWRSSTAKLREAKPVDPPASPSAADKGPTKAQKERAVVGAVSLYEFSVDAPAMKIKSTFQKEERITAVSPTGYTVEVDVVKGSPPAGAQVKGTVQVGFADSVDFGSWKIGETQEENSNGARVTRTRLADEPVKVGETSFDCIVVQVKARTADGGTSMENKSWFAKSTEIPGIGFVKEEITQEIAGLQGKIRLSQTTTLLSVRRPKN